MFPSQVVLKQLSLTVSHTQHKLVKMIASLPNLILFQRGQDMLVQLSVQTGLVIIQVSNKEAGGVAKQNIGILHNSDKAGIQLS